MTKESVTEHVSVARYDINDIVKIWNEQGWHGLDLLAGQMRGGICYHKKNEKDKVGFVFRQFVQWLAADTLGDEHFGGTMTEGEYLLECVANPSDDRYYTPLSEDHVDRLAVQVELARGYRAKSANVLEVAAKAEKRMRVGLEKILTAFTICPDKEHLISTLLPPALAKTYCYELFGDTPVPCWEHFGPWPITEEDKGIATWLLDVLNDKKSCREAYWNCVWIAGQGVIHILLDITDRIEKDVPVTDEQVSTLNRLVSRASPRGYWQSAADGSSRFVFEASPEMNSWPCCSGTLDTLLAQAAFSLLQRLWKACSSSRFIRTCRAPSCGKSFHTSRRKQMYCSATDENVTSPCKAEGDAYRKYLLKMGKKPDLAWEDPNHLKNFQENYRRRGSQCPALLSDADI